MVFTIDFDHRPYNTLAVPCECVISASDLTTVTTGNSMHKYADDTYIVIPARNAPSREADIISHLYILRPRRHNFILNTKTDERSFTARQLFSDIY